jgi:hypothetical protein
VSAMTAAGTIGFALASVAAGAYVGAHLSPRAHEVRGAMAGAAAGMAVVYAAEWLIAKATPAATTPVVSP